MLGLLAAILGIGLVAADAAIRPPDASARVSAPVDRGRTGITADALPTVQINGVVWTQLVVGNTVYAGGQFSTARPAGSAPGKNTVRRSNLLAFDIRTGKLIASFAPAVNGAVRALAVSPDKKTLYVGGAFTAVNGKKRLRLAAVTTGGGTLRSFAPAFNNPVRAIVATSSTLYVGGSFSRVGSAKRSRLAALSTSTREAAIVAPGSERRRAGPHPDPGSQGPRGRRFLCQDRADSRVRDVAAQLEQGIRTVLADQLRGQELREGHGDPQPHCRREPGLR